MNTHIGIWSDLVAKKADRENCCGWKGISCFDGIVRGVSIDAPNQERIADMHVQAYYMSLHWLPNTITYLEVTKAELAQKFRIRSLPRDLRICNLNGMMVGDPFDATPLAVTNFGDLPKNLETFNLHAYDGFFGTICIPSLPQTLRKCCIQSKFLSRVILQNSALPGGLQSIEFSGRNIKFINVDGQKRDKRVKRMDRGSVSLMF